MTIDELLRLSIVATKEALTHNERFRKLSDITVARDYLMQAYKLVNEGKVYEQ